VEVTVTTTNRALIDRWFSELWGKRNAGIIDEMVHPDCHIWGLPGSKHGPAGFKPFYKAFGDAFPKVALTVEDSVENGDKIAFRCSLEVTTHDGKQHAITGGAFVRFERGRIIEAWNQFDFLTLLNHTGQVPVEAFPNALASLAARKR
jgi:hypothetical protein